MERVAFLVEKTGDRIQCLLNPASIVIRRTAGVRPRHSNSGPLTGAALSDDPLLFTGGGMTELLLDLLFDVSLVNQPEVVENVQDLTLPLTRLAEGITGDDGYSQAPLIRFIWGKAWNVLGVVAAVSERLEGFTSSGTPQRSWLRMRLLRVSETTAAPAMSVFSKIDPLETIPDRDSISPDDLNFYQVQGTGDDPQEGHPSERLDEIAAQRYGDPSWWKLIAAFNKIDNPWTVAPGEVLVLPPGPSPARTA
jgi:Contractile injection system tube protein